MAKTATPSMMMLRRIPSKQGRLQKSLFLLVGLWLFLACKTTDRFFGAAADTIDTAATDSATTAEALGADAADTLGVGIVVSGVIESCSG
jgi:hypothetical protein